MCTNRGMCRLIMTNERDSPVCLMLFTSRSSVVPMNPPNASSYLATEKRRRSPSAAHVNRRLPCCSRFSSTASMEGVSIASQRDDVTRASTTGSTGGNVTTLSGIDKRCSSVPGSIVTFRLKASAMSAVAVVNDIVDLSLDRPCLHRLIDDYKIFTKINQWY